MQDRVGILRIGSLGDHLIALPLYRQIRELHGQETLILICNQPAHGNSKIVGPASVLPASIFDAVLDYPIGSDWRSMARKYRLFRGAGLRLLYYLMPRRNARQLWRDRLFFWLVGTRVVGLGSETQRGPAGESSEAAAAEHEAKRLARAIPVLAEGLRNTPQSRSMAITAAEHSEARARLGPPTPCTVALSIGTKCDVKDWGLDRWSVLVSRLGNLRQIDRIVLLGAADEFDDCEKLKALWPRRCDNFCGRLSPRLSAAVLAQAQLFVGHDSGPMHMAAAVNVPIVAIFSSRDLPGVWFPLSENKHIHYTVIECMGCGRLRCEDRHKECIRRITVDEVYSSCVAALA